jgi:hypothetical protein
MFITVFVRRLRPGKSYDDLIDAWYPDKGFGVPARVTTATNVDDEREVLTIGVMDADLSPEALQAVAPQEAVRHDRLDDVIESTTLRAFYDLEAEFDFSTDETVAKGRP